MFHPVRTNPDGTLPLDAARGSRFTLPAHDYHFFHYAPPGVICLENTHNRCGGRIVPPAYFAEVAAIARKHDVPVHLDGARLFNAAVAAGRPVTDWTQHVSSVQLCLSKGLSAPVGSMICGSAEFVKRARWMRKMLGGGMRQVGVIAAPGIVALTEMVGRLAEDHRNARILADGIAALKGVALDPPEVDTNIVVFRMPSVAKAEAFAEALAATGRADFGLRRRPPARRHALRHSEADCRQAVSVMQSAWPGSVGT